jgi:uncharacterized membrane protein
LEFINRISSNKLRRLFLAVAFVVFGVVGWLLPFFYAVILPAARHSERK